MSPFSKKFSSSQLSSQVQTVLLRNDDWDEAEEGVCCFVVPATVRSWLQPGYGSANVVPSERPPSSGSGSLSSHSSWQAGDPAAFGAQPLC
eukprot:symbB.v1.2.030514.t1/scaffold3445.1/size56522/2